MASGNLNPGLGFIGNKPQITYDTDDTGLNMQNTSAQVCIVSNGVQFEFTGNTPGNAHYHTSGVIPSGAVSIKKMTPTLTFDSGDVKALYEIEVTDKPAFESNF